MNSTVRVGTLKRRYTERIHAQRVKRVIEKEKPCKHCPAAQEFRVDNTWYELWNVDTDGHGFIKNIHHPCTICAKFLGLKHQTPKRVRCPCHRLGTKRAVELTWRALEAKGYL